MEGLSLRPEGAQKEAWETVPSKEQKKTQQSSNSGWREEDDREFTRVDRHSHHNNSARDQQQQQRRSSIDREGGNTFPQSKREYNEAGDGGKGSYTRRDNVIGVGSNTKDFNNNNPSSGPRGYEKRGATSTQGANDFYNNNNNNRGEGGNRSNRTNDYGPGRPNQNRSGFSIGRGRGMGRGGAGQHSGPGGGGGGVGGFQVDSSQPFATGFDEKDLEAEQTMSCVSEKFEKSIKEQSAEFEKLFKDERESNPDREHIDHIYSAVELVKILRDLEQANKCELPAEVDKDSVPLKSVQPGDILWDLTMFANRAKSAAPSTNPSKQAWKEGDERTRGKKGDIGDGKGAYSYQGRDDDTPEWAKESNSLKDRTDVGDFFLGSAMPALTEEEKRQMRAEISSGVTRKEARVVPENDSIEQLDEASINALNEDTFSQDIRVELQEQEAMKQQGQPRQQSRLFSAPLEEDSPNVASGGGFFGDLNAPNMQQQQQALEQQLQMQQQQQQQQQIPIPMNWMYLDPAGAPQGPFTRDEITEWHQGGFFPMDLPLRPSNAPNFAKYVPLESLVKSGWRYDQVLNAMNSGGRPMSQSQVVQQQQQQHRAVVVTPQSTAVVGGGGGLLSNIMGSARAQAPSQSVPLEQTKSLADLEGGSASKPVVSQPRGGMPAPKPNAQAGGLLGSIMGSGGGASAQQQQQQKGMGMSLQEMEQRQRAMMVLEKQSEESARLNRQQQEQAQQEQKRLELERQQKQVQQMQQMQQQQKPAWGGATPAAIVNESRSLADIQREEAELERQRQLNNPIHVSGGGQFGTPWGGGAPQNVRAQQLSAVPSGSLAEVMAQEQAQARRRQEALQREANARNANMKSGWQGNGGMAQNIGASKSLAEIQREEEERRQREQQMQQMQQGPGLPQAALGTAWATGKLANPNSSQQNLPPAPRTAPSGMMMPRQMQGSQRKVQSDFDRPDLTQQRRSNPSVRENSVANLNQGSIEISSDSWGLPPAPGNKRALQQWCKRAMTTLNGSEDLTLVDFLLSLASAGEVQEYVGLYMGNTARAQEFGLELIKQKRADPSLSQGLSRL